MTWQIMSFRLCQETKLAWLMELPLNLPDHFKNKLGVQSFKFHEESKNSGNKFYPYS